MMKGVLDLKWDRRSHFFIQKTRHFGPLGVGLQSFCTFFQMDDMEVSEVSKMSWVGFPAPQPLRAGKGLLSAY